MGQTATATPSAKGSRIEELHLSEWAIAALEREVNSVIADDRIYGAPDDTNAARSANATRKTRRHWRVTTAISDARFLVVPVTLMFLVIGLVAEVGTTYLMAGIAFAGMVVGVGIVAEVIAGMLRETEHVSPETHALLEHEGIADPDRLFGELLAERRAA